MMDEAIKAEIIRGLTSAYGEERAEKLWAEIAGSRRDQLAWTYFLANKPQFSSTASSDSFLFHEAFNFADRFIAYAKAHR